MKYIQIDYFNIFKELTFFLRFTNSNNLNSQLVFAKSIEFKNKYIYFKNIILTASHVAFIVFFFFFI